MRLRLGGLPFDVEPDAAITTHDEAILAPLERGDPDASPVFVLRLVSEAPFALDPARALPGLGEAALVERRGEAIAVAKDSFTAELRPRDGGGVLFRRAGGESGLTIALKVALSSVLPRHGGLAFHAAAVARGGDALVFFGPSGAGKTTISGLSPFPVLSDELVALRRDGEGGCTVRASGFWGSLDRREAPRGAFRVRALFALAQGDANRSERLGKAEAFRALLGAALVPPEPSLWRTALGVLDEIASEIPVARLTWRLAEPPWPALEEAWRGGVGD